MKKKKIKNIDASEPSKVPNGPELQKDLFMVTLAEMQDRHVRYVLEGVKWNFSEAARVLGISRGRLDRMIMSLEHHY